MPYRNVKRRKLLSRSAVLSLIMLLLVGAAIADVAVHRHNNKASQSGTTSSSARPANTVDYSPATKTDNTTNEDRKSSPAASDTLNKPATTNTRLAVTILNANVVTDSGARFVHVGNQVDGTTSGTCTLSATKPGQPNVTDTSTVRLDANTYTCGVFNTPTSDFPASGTWNLTLTVKSNGSSASASSTVSI